MLHQTPQANNLKSSRSLFASLQLGSFYHSFCSDMADIQAIAKQFTDFYYTTFDSNRPGLQSLYVRRVYATLESPLLTYLHPHIA